MSQDIGIIITQPGTDVVGSSASKQVMNTTHPYLKIDTQNPVANQTLLLILTTNPPEPVGPSWASTYTIVYKFKHGYTYIPAVESLFFVQTPPPGTSYSQTYFIERGIIGAQTVDDSAVLYCVADATWVYYIVQKNNDGLGSANLLTGTNILITTHVYLDGVGV